MGKLRFDCYEEFAKRIEFPMLVIKAESGEVVIMNYEAKLLLGQKTQSVTLGFEPAVDEERFWNRLHDRKAITERYLIISNENRTVPIRALVNMFEVEGEQMLMLLFDQRSGLGMDGMILEQIVENSNVVIVHLSVEHQEEIKLNYISRNIKRYGYTSEEFYAGRLKFKDLIHPDDLDMVLGQLAKRDNDMQDRDSLEYRVVSESREVFVVRGSVHLLRNSLGKIEGIELIMTDITEEVEEKDENQYLRSAIEQSRSVVLVKRFLHEKGTVKYVSRNARNLGIDVEDLQKGRKTFTDYIVPEDRKMMTDILLNAQKIPVKNYTNRCRLLGEDGVVRWIKFYLSVKNLDEYMYDVELLINDATEEKSYEQNLLQEQRALEEKLEYVVNSQEQDPEHMLEEFLKAEEMQDFMEAFAANNQLYAAIVCRDGAMLTRPVGPMMRLGEFYDFLERPNYREQLMEALKGIDGRQKYYIWELDHGRFERQIAAVPLEAGDGNIYAACLVCALDEEAVTRLHNVLEAFQTMLEMIVKAGYKNQYLERDSRKSRLAEREKSEDLERQIILSKAFARMGNDTDETIQEILANVGELLHFTSIAVYCGDSMQEAYMNRTSWIGKEAYYKTYPAQSWRLAELCRKNEAVSKGGYLIYEPGVSGDAMEYLASQTQAKSMMIFGIVVNDEIHGGMTVVCQEKRVFLEREIAYCKNVVEIIQGILTRSQNTLHVKRLNKDLLNAYNYMTEYVFIKDYQTGKVLFANEKMENLFGMDVTGMDSRSFIGTPSPIYTREGVQNTGNIKWQSYISRLNKIMNIQELVVEWENGADARLVIMREKNG